MYSSLLSHIRPAYIPVTTVRLSTGLGRDGGCRLGVTRADRRCSVCCGWGVWCCHLMAGSSSPSGPAAPFFHTACCSSATLLSPNWSKQVKKRNKRRLGYLKWSEVQFDSFMEYFQNITYIGGGQGFWLQSLVSPRGFMLDLLQKLLWTILLSTFLLQPYRRYCLPAVSGDEKLTSLGKKITKTSKQSLQKWFQKHNSFTTSSNVPPPQSLEQ